MHNSCGNPNHLNGQQQVRIFRKIHMLDLERDLESKSMEYIHS